MDKFESAGLTIAVLVPCFNEEVAISQVVRDFRIALPSAAIYVYDNQSSDRTVEIASAAGAVVRSEPAQGKGNVVRRMFADVDADVYVMVDGDATYEAASAPKMIHKLISDDLDMVVASRVDAERDAYRHGHRLGNTILTAFVSYLFGKRFTDILSGYRVLSRRFVKSFPALSSGFEIETELTVHALELRMPAVEIPTAYGVRPSGSESKLRTYTDGLKILRLIIGLFKDEKPLLFFGIIAALFALTAFALAIPLLFTYMETGLVPRIPTAVLAATLMVVSFLSLTCGLILDTVTRGRKEMKRLAYLVLSEQTAARFNSRL